MLNYFNEVGLIPGNWGAKRMAGILAYLDTRCHVTSTSPGSAFPALHQLLLRQSTGEISSQFFTDREFPLLQNDILSLTGKG